MVRIPIRASSFFAMFKIKRKALVYKLLYEGGKMLIKSKQSVFRFSLFHQKYLFHQEMGTVK